MVFGLDDKPILGIESRALGTTFRYLNSITLNSNTHKQKRNNLNNRKSIDIVIILSETINKTMIVLAQVLTFTLPKQALTLALALRPITLIVKQVDVIAFEQKITIMEA